MSDHQSEVKFDDMVVDQDYQDEEMFSQLAQKDQDLESDIDMIDEEIQRKNERIMQLELMLEEKQDWFNLKTQMVFEIPANESLTGLDDLKVTYAIENLTRTKTSQYDEDFDWKDMTSINIAYELKLDKQVHFDENQTRKKSELINGNNQFNTVSGTAKNPLTETSKEHGLKKSLSMESVFEGDGTKMRPSFKWQMGDECVSLEKYIHVYTRNPEDLYEAVKKRAIEKEEEEDYEENELYHKEIKASLIGIDETKMKSNLRILDNFIREEEEKEKAKSTPKQVNSENADEAIDGTLNEKRRRKDKAKSELKQVHTKNVDQTAVDVTDNKSELKQVVTENVDQAAVDAGGNDKIKDEKNSSAARPNRKLL
ncbi:unnamed protein product [Mytilus edulis]|uniref:Uncharacterized protein n=1 Tax=Mytilus edulis TaxID=6550 RepID=A0A8S3R3T4_MYTED|nr:unnamed protein product [Mytilus edulis]